MYLGSPPSYSACLLSSTIDKSQLFHFNIIFLSQFHLAKGLCVRYCIARANAKGRHILAGGEEAGLSIEYSARGEHKRAEKEACLTTW